MDNTFFSDRFVHANNFFSFSEFPLTFGVVIGNFPSREQQKLS